MFGVDLQICGFQLSAVNIFFSNCMTLKCIYDDGDGGGGL